MEFIIVLVIVIVAGVFIGYKLKKIFKNRRECYQEREVEHVRPRPKPKRAKKTSRRDRSDSFEDW